MKRFGWLISRYLLQNIIPYFIFSWVLLSVILFVQQASRFSDIFFSVNIPKKLVFELTFALVPNVIAFTCPMAILTGVIIGLSKMQGDSELIAMRAAGIGNFQITLSIFALGLLLSAFAFFINSKGVPAASAIVRSIALQTALLKLESPIEPGAFNTEINGYTIFVKNGDLINGDWENIFIYQDAPNSKQTRLITAESGRIDSTTDATREVAELVLKNAVVTTLPNTLADLQANKINSENIGEIRLSIKTKRDEIIKKLTSSQETPEELGLAELAQLVRDTTGKEQTEARILWQRRLMLSITPAIFALLGTVLVLRFNRGSRGFGIFLALVCLVAYYLLALLGEQLTRTNSLNSILAGFLPIIVGLSIIGWYFMYGRTLHRNYLAFGQGILSSDFFSRADKPARSNFYIDLTTGIRDFDIVMNLLKYFILTLVFLTAVYLIFTTFELWKFVGVIPGGLTLLGQYLFFLLPFIYLQLAPSALMIATLTTFVIKSRQNEIVSWASAGQSIYRLLVPCFGLMLLIGVVNWGIQEYIAPKTNQKQDALRTQIRNKGISSVKEGKFWVAVEMRIYSFETVGRKSGQHSTVGNLKIYQFSEDSKKLEIIYLAKNAIRQDNQSINLQQVEKISLVNRIVTSEKAETLMLTETENPFDNLNQKPSHLNSTETKLQLAETESDSEKRNLETALHKKHITLLLPFIIGLFTAPFALSLSRKGKVLTIGAAVGLWLVFMAVSSFFEQAALNGNLSAQTAIWMPLLLFSTIGVYLLTKVRT